MAGVPETPDRVQRNWASPFVIRWIVPAIALGILTTIFSVMSLDAAGTAYAEDEPTRSIAIVLLGWVTFVVPAFGAFPIVARNAAIALTTSAYWAVLFAPIQWVDQSRGVRVSLRIAKYALVISHIGITFLFLWFFHVLMVEMSATFAPGGEY